METPWCKQKPLSARCPGPVLIGGWLPWRHIPPVPPSSKPSPRSPSLSSGCWPSTEKAKDTLLSRPEASRSSFSSDAFNISMPRFVTFSWGFLRAFLYLSRQLSRLSGLELAHINKKQRCLGGCSVCVVLKSSRMLMLSGLKMFSCHFHAKEYENVRNYTYDYIMIVVMWIMC